VLQQGPAAAPSKDASVKARGHYGKMPSNHSEQITPAEVC